MIRRIRNQAPWSPFQKQADRIYTSYSISRVTRNRRLDKRIKSQIIDLSCQSGVLQRGTAFPRPENMAMGRGKSIYAAIMFFDIVESTSRISTLQPLDQLFILNLILSTVTIIVRDSEATIEKNTGDGIMAIFDRSAKPVILDSIETAVTIQYYMENDIRNALEKRGLLPQQFRIGIDAGETLVSKIGIANHNFVTAIGDVPARANQLQELSPVNGICIGENIFRHLGGPLQNCCHLRNDPEWKWQYKETAEPYNFYCFEDRP
jgi:adenylate cyclase